jgi:Transposase DDE domain group 1
LPIHIYEAASGKPVAVILRPGKTPGGAEVTMVLRHVVRAIRRRWPAVDIPVRGDSHYGRPEAMAWLERNRAGYIFGLAGNQVLLGKVRHLAEDAAVGRIDGEAAKARRYGEFRDAAKTWHAQRQVIARVEASTQGTDCRFIVTNLNGAPRWLYEEVYCARGHRAWPDPPAGCRRRRPGRELDQGAQAAPRLGSDLVQQGHRQPVPAARPHRCPLAPAHAARPGAQGLVLARGAVRHHRACGPIPRREERQSRSAA